jgi:putative transposase
LAVQAIKAVQQKYVPTNELLDLLEQFRQMVNACIRIGLADNVTSLKALSVRAYRQLNGYDIPTYYRLNAMSVATSILRNYRRALRKGQNPRMPYARKRMITTCYRFRIENARLLISIRPRTRSSILLNRHTLAALRDHEVRSVTLTPDKLAVTYRKEVETIVPTGFLGVDRNLNNVTVAGTDGSAIRYDLSLATRCNETYRMVKAHLRRNDDRVRRQLYRKYGSKQTHKVSQILHRVSKQIVSEAKTRRYCIVMESLRGMRRLYRRRNGQGRKYRSRLNAWPFAELQRQIDYKARWDGLPVIYVEPHGTSAECSICGHKLKPEKNRMLKCHNCGLEIDRDLNAARNIMARGLRFGPDGWAVEGMVEKTSQEVILKLDALQSSHLPKA